MFLRAALFACAAVTLAATLSPVMADTPPAAPQRCEETSFRIYFPHGSTQLGPAAREVLAAAQRDTAGCSYRELHVRLDASAPYARQRGQAILAAAHAGSWNVARLEQRGGVQRASMTSGPDYAEVVMTPNVLPASPALPTGRNVGV